ncbi:hypothetical protein HELRODRAFT_186293 [Helobdella robusta]|uniref:gamma-glutamylcyclotransferase n=1 Tax=Helobdella robusta TaxID=6412 RepID=T1FNX8_HELRO|nr:hypothetical protein HELRODRAFT_186293 [Helobdella robusta]ESO09758.1 hypothetical protein HELRODRAFT_186293 [Helobdella robusta]
MMGKKFYYFAFGSNLLRQRMELNKYSYLKFSTIAKLNDFKLDFGWNSKTWNGAVATIIPCCGSHVWGVVWTMDVDDINILNEQEGVSSGVYEPFSVDVATPNDEIIQCRSYRLLKEKLESDKPSKSYLDVIIKGALQHNLPRDYVQWLKHRESNGLQASKSAMEKFACLFEN